MGLFSSIQEYLKFFQHPNGEKMLMLLLKVNSGNAGCGGVLRLPNCSLVFASLALWEEA